MISCAIPINDIKMVCKYVHPYYIQKHKETMSLYKLVDKKVSPLFRKL